MDLIRVLKRAKDLGGRPTKLTEHVTVRDHRPDSQRDLPACRRRGPRDDEFALSVRNVRPYEHGCHLPETQYVPGASPDGGADSRPLEVPPGSIARGTSEGQPTLLTPEVEARLTASIRAGAFESGAAEAAGIGRRTFVGWMQ
jgi:hypothetical protein